MERLTNPPKNTESDAHQMVSNLVDLKPSSSPAKISKPVKSKSRHHFYRTPWFWLIILFFVGLLSVSLYTGYVLRAVYTAGQNTLSSGKSIAASLAARNLGEAKSALETTKSSLKAAQTEFEKLKFYDSLPILNAYYRDALHVFAAGEQGLASADIAFTTLENYADVLGFTGASAGPEFDSAEARVIFLATTVEKLAPVMDELAAKLQGVNNEIAAIDDKRYPVKIGDIAIRSRLVGAKQTISSATTALTQFQPIVKLLPTLLGNPTPKRYLLLFQNNAELRPTGGFMTAYATLTVDKGRFIPGVSEDIYALDARFTKKVPAPETLHKYLNVSQWHLRDMNINPDFKFSMDQFTEYYRGIPNAPEVDGIIAIDTELPVRLLKILGPIGVGGYGGNFSAEDDPRCNCPQVIYALESIADERTYEIKKDRKAVLGPLMNSILGNMLGSPKARWPEFFNVFTGSIREKHLLMYFFDPELQHAAEVLGAGGRINEYTGDYLHINDANLGGAKSNLFIESEVEETINIDESGSLTKKLTLTYRNPAVGSNCNLETGKLCLNGVMRDWTRIYVPKGSILTSAKGYEQDVVTKEELGKTVFEGYFTLYPQGVKKLELEYTVPSIGKGDYKLLIQKQPGTDVVNHTILVNGRPSVVYPVSEDTEVVLPR